MTDDLLARLEALAASAPSEMERLTYRAQRAGVIARLGHIETARREVETLRSHNASYSPQLTAWILLAEGLADHYESLSTRAIDRFKRAYGLGAAIGDAEIRSLAAAWMGASEFLMAHYETAFGHAVEAIQLSPRGASLSPSRAHLVLANCFSLVEEIALAAQHYRDARNFAVEARDISMQSAILYNVAAFRIARISLADAFGEPVDLEARVAVLELRSITNLDSGLRVDSLRAMVPLLRAQLALTSKQWADADAIYAGSIAEASSHGQLREAPRFLAEQAHCHAMLGRRESALENATKATAQISPRTDLDDLAACHARLALCFDALDLNEQSETYRKLAIGNRAEYVVFQTRLRAKILEILGSAKLG